MFGKRKASADATKTPSIPTKRGQVQLLPPEVNSWGAFGRLSRLGKWLVGGAIAIAMMSLLSIGSGGGLLGGLLGGYLASKLFNNNSTDKKDQASSRSGGGGGGSSASSTSRAGFGGTAGAHGGSGG